MGATARNLDMSNVKDGAQFNQSRIPAGDYLAIISKVEDATTKSKKESWVFSIKLKNRPSSVFRYQCLLEEKMLWKVRNLAIAAGKTVPKKKLKLDPNQLVGKLIGVTVEDDEDYIDKNDKVHEQSEIIGVFPAADLGDDEGLTNDDAPIDTDEDDDDDADLGPTPSAAVADDEDEDEEDEGEGEASEEDELAGLSRAELKERIRAVQPDFVVKKSMSDDDLRAIVVKLSAEGDEEEEAPAPTQKKTSSSKRKEAQAKVADDDIDDLDIDDL